MNNNNLFEESFKRFRSVEDDPTSESYKAAYAWLESLDDAGLLLLWDRFDIPVYDRDAVEEMQRYGEYDLPTEGMRNDDIDESFVIWKRGTPRMKIWNWFDDHLSKGLSAAVYQS